MIFYRVKALIEQNAEEQVEGQERERRSLNRQRTEMICSETEIFNSVFDERYIFTASLSKGRVHMNVVSKQPIEELYIQQYLSSLLYRYATGGTVCVECNEEFSDDTEYSNPLLDGIQLSVEKLLDYKNNVLTIFWLPKSNRKTKEILFSCVENCTFVEIKEDVAFDQVARTYLKDKAIEHRVKPNRKLLGEIKDNQTGYTPSDLEEIFDRWFEDYLKTEKYPQYASLDSVKKANAKQKPKGSAYEELQSMIGLKNAKQIVEEALNYYKAQQLYCDKGFGNAHPSMHMVFTGNPGTAKTTVARLFAQIMKDNGVLSEGTLHEVGRADLVGKYVGWTAQLVKDKFKKAKGGVLFIDEAYSLLDDRSGMYGDEAINTIVQEDESKGRRLCDYMHDVKDIRDVLGFIRNQNHL